MDTSALLAELKEIVFTQQEVLGEIYAHEHGTSVFDYVQSWTTHGTTVHPLVIKHLHALLSRTYSADIVAGVIAQLIHEPLVSTIDHHGICNHPFFLNSNLIASVRNTSRYIVCLTASGVSLNNSSTWSGCLVAHHNGALERFSFFSDAYKTHSIFQTPALTKDNVQKVLQHIHHSPLPVSHQQKLTGLVEELISNSPVLEFERFSDQASALSTVLWQKVFPDSPTLVYLPLEELASSMLIEILQDSRHPITALLTTETGWLLVEKYFHGSPGAFTNQNKGSFLFWGASQGRRVHLSRQEGAIAGDGISFQLTPEYLITALNNRSIYPTMMVAYLVASFFGGLTCLGGFNQVNRLTHIAEQYQQLFTEWNYPEIATMVSRAHTKYFAETDVAFIRSGDSIVPAGVLDVYLSGIPDAYHTYQRVMKRLTLGHSIELALPTIYNVITPADRRNPLFSAVTREDIAACSSASLL